MIIFDELAKELYEILHARYKNIRLFDDEGNKVPSEDKGLADARRFYVSDMFLISILDDGENSSIRMYFDSGIDFDDVKELIDTLKALATSYNILISIKRSDKKIKLADYSNTEMLESIKDNMNIFENMYGTSRGSYLNLNNGARFIIKENLAYVEDSTGDRREFDNIDVAKEVAIHLHNGGSFHDQVCDQIVRLADSFAQLKEGKTWKDEKDGAGKKWDWKAKQQERKTNKDKRMSGEDLEEDSVFNRVMGKKADDGADNYASIMGQRNKPEAKSSMSQNPKKVEEAVDHAAEADRYERLAKEAHGQLNGPHPVSAQPPEYYEKKAREHRAMAGNLNEFEMKPTPDSKKGMFKGKTQEEIKSMLSNIKEKMAKAKEAGHEVSHDLRSKFSQLEFALRAKHNWGSVKEEEMVDEGRTEDMDAGQEKISVLGKPVAKGAWDALKEGNIEFYSQPELNLGFGRGTPLLVKVASVLGQIAPQIKSDSLSNLIAHISDHLSEERDATVKQGMIRLASFVLKAAGVNIESLKESMSMAEKELTEWFGEFSTESIFEDEGTQKKSLDSIQDIKDEIKNFPSADEAYSHMKTLTGIPKHVAEQFQEMYGYDDENKTSEGFSKKLTARQAFDRMYADARNGMNESINEATYDHDRGEVYYNNDDYAKEDVYDEFVNRVRDDFDFEKFARYDDRLLLWDNKDSLTPEEKEVQYSELMGDLESYLQKEIETDSEGAYTDADVDQVAEELYNKIILPELIQAGYNVVNATMTEDEEENVLTREDILMPKNQGEQLKSELSTGASQSELERLKLLAGLR